MKETLQVNTYFYAGDEAVLEIYSDHYTPFEVGEIIQLTVRNDKPLFWAVENFSKSYKIEKIAKNILKNYSKSEEVLVRFDIYIDLIEV